jgi:alpha-maltose-1-phosphate synthase
MRTLLVHPGTQHSFRLASQLQRHGILNRFCTGFAFVPNSLLGHCIQHLPKGIRNSLSNRRLDGVSIEKLRSWPYVEWRALRRLRAGEDFQRVMFERNAAFQRGLSCRELRNCDAVIGFDTASWLLAERANTIGCPFVLDQSIGHPLSYQRLLSKLRCQFPEWADDMPTRLPELLLAEETEHRRASRIVVASSFTRRSLIDNGVREEKITINPYGVELDAFSPAPRPDSSRPFRFLFLGSLCARKGVPLLLKVWSSIETKDAELWLAGPVSKRHRRLIPATPGLRIIDKVSRGQLPNLLRQCDVLVLPSYLEGFGLVLLEALAAGMPIIGSDATAAPDLLTDGVEGYVIGMGDAEALRDKLLRFIASPSDLARMSPAARLCAERHSWDAYGNRWADFLRQVA